MYAVFGMLRSAQQQVQKEFKQVVRERRRAYVQNRFDCVVRHLGLKACMWYYCKCAQLLDCYSTLIVCIVKQVAQGRSHELRTTCPGLLAAPIQC